MKTSRSTILLIIVLNISSCSTYDKQSRKIKSANKRFETKHVLLLGCAYETTKGTCVYFWPSHHFSIEFSYTRYAKEYYAGTYFVKADTIYLLFYKDIRPANRTNYFLKDTADKYILTYPTINGGDRLRFDLKKPYSVL